MSVFREPELEVSAMKSNEETAQDMTSSANLPGKRCEGRKRSVRTDGRGREGWGGADDQADGERLMMRG